MKLFRSIAMLLIFALVSSPALAAICATSCASQMVMATMHADDMSGMEHCQHHSNKNKEDQNKSTTEHKSCTMGASCSFTLVTTLDSSLNYSLADLTSSFLPIYIPTDKSVDLSPPLKPPA
jgi:hypothetical protein